jgi:hypothetical protein
MARRIVAARLEAGQVAECDLTLRDVDRSQDAFVGQLLGMYHQRIAYPHNKVVALEARRAAAAAAGAPSDAAASGDEPPAERPASGRSSGRGAPSA